MSFADRVKTELSGQVPRNACCRRAVGAGVATGSPAGGEGAFRLTLPDAECGDFAKRMLSARFGRDIEVTSRSGRGGRVTLEFSPPAAFSFAEPGKIREEFKCSGCEAAFLRGLFIASASISDPRASSYHAEFVLPDPRAAGAVYELLLSSGIAPKLIGRRRGTGLYFKDSEKIEELLVRIGAKSAAFEMINCKIERTIRNDENRATNCVTQNIERTVSASRRQVEDILKLTETGRLEGLSYDVRVTAKLRLENPEASLSELAALHKPPISKSGLNHRLEKIAAEAEKI